MIFVTVGTIHFDELVKAVDGLAGKSKERFVIQLGTGKYIPKNCEWFRLKPSLSEFYSKCSLVITHGGAGTLFECLNAGVRTIAIPNPNAKDAHQLDLLSELARRNYIITCDLADLKRAIMSKVKLRKYIRPKCEIG